VPQQQLFMMNNRFVIAAAESIVARMRQGKNAADDRSRVKYLYRQILARDATQREMDMMAAYVRQEPADDAVQQTSLLPSQSYGAPTIQQQVKSGESRDWDAARDFGGHGQSAGPLDVWSKVAQVLLQSNEFMFID
jgi:hypothetical protein